MRSDDELIDVIRTFFTGAEKTQMYKYAGLGFTPEDKSKNIPVVKKKLQSELRVVDLKCFSSRQFC